MLKRFFTGILGVCMIFSVAMAREDIMQEPQINILQKKIIYSDDERIIGMMRIKNNADAYFPDMYYDLGLVSYESTSEENVYEECVIGRSEPVKFSLGANQEKDVYFTYDIPQYLPDNVTELMVTFSTRTMQLSEGKLSFELDNAIKRDSGFILPDFSEELAVWDINGEVVRADTGPNVTASSKPVAKISLKSTFNKSVTVTPKITIYKRSVSFNSEPVLSRYGESIKIPANGTKNVEISIPVVSSPDSYFVNIEFCNESGECVSHEYDFRYVVEGMNAKILASYLTDNENGLKLNVFATGPADGKDKLLGASLYCIVKASDDDTVYYDERFDANLGAVLGRKVIPLERYEVPVTISLRLEKNGTVYDEFEYNVDLKHLTSDSLEFSDVYDDITKEAVGVLSSIGMISGYPDGTFRPNNTITRAEFTVIATRLAGLKITPGQASVFEDVSNDHWAKDYINLAQANGCISGYGDGTFRPNNNVTIAESMTILINVLGYRNKAVSNESQWPLNYLEVAEEFGLNKNVVYDSYMGGATRGNVSIMTLNSYIYKMLEGGN